MSGCLEGEDAFDRVLDALREEVRKGAGDREKVRFLEERMTQLSGEMADRYATIRRLEKTAEDFARDDEPKVQRLHEAAKTMLMKLTATLGDAGIVAPTLDSERKALKIAIDETSARFGSPF